MSTWPKLAQISARAEERNESRADRATYRRRWRFDDLQRRGQEGEIILFARSFAVGKETIFLVAAIAALADFMDATLQSVKRRVAPALADQLVVSTIFNEAPMVQGEDTIGGANRGQAMGDNENRAPVGDLRHIPLDDPLAFIIEGARGFVKDQHSGLT